MGRDNPHFLTSTSINLAEQTQETTVWQQITSGKHDCYLHPRLLPRRTNKDSFGTSEVDGSTCKTSPQVFNTVEIDVRLLRARDNPHFPTSINLAEQTHGNNGLVTRQIAPSEASTKYL